MLASCVLTFATVCHCSGSQRNEALKDTLSFAPDAVLLPEEEPGLDSSLGGMTDVTVAMCRRTPAPVRMLAARYVSAGNWDSGGT